MKIEEKIQIYRGNDGGGGGDIAPHITCNSSKNKEQPPPASPPNAKGEFSKLISQINMRNLISCIWHPVSCIHCTLIKTLFSSIWYLVLVTLRITVSSSLSVSRSYIEAVKVLSGKSFH